MPRLSTLLPLALVGTSAMVSPLASASPIRRDFTSSSIVAGVIPSVLNPDGSLNHNLLGHDLQQALERAVGQLEEVVDTTGSKLRLNKVAKRAASSAPLTNFQDLIYLADVSVGSPAQKIPLIVDTGSADIVIPSSGEECNAAVPCFDSSASSSFADSGETVTFKYGQGNTEGKVVTDSVSLGGLTVKNQQFGLISSADSAALNKEANGGIPVGILGLSWPSIKKLPGATFLENLISSKQLPKNLFGLYLAPSGQTGSEISFGAADSDRYTGSPVAHPVQSKTHWTLELNALEIAGSPIFTGHVNTLIDSGTTSSVIPNAAAEAFFAQIDGAAPAVQIPKEVNGEQVLATLYVMPCSNTVSPQFSFKGGRRRTFNIAPQDLILAPADAEGKMCFSSLIGADASYEGKQAALLGIPFLKSWYSIYNVDDATVSFAAAK